MARKWREGGVKRRCSVAPVLVPCALPKGSSESLPKDAPNTNCALCHFYIQQGRRKVRNSIANFRNYPGRVPGATRLRGDGFGRFQRLGEQRTEQAAAGGAAVVQAGFELIAEGHEFIDFGDDAMLFR